MNQGVLRRFIKYMIAALVVSGLFVLGYKHFTSDAPGDFYVREGDIRLGDGLYDEALEAFGKALGEMPDHRGALMGRALTFIQMDRHAEAIAELDHLIEFMESTLEETDTTGRGVLAAAYSNRGIVHDRLGRYELALKDYISALNTDRETVAGPGVVHKILYGGDDVSTVRDRAQYIFEQLQLPESDRLLSIPELDAKQRMYKP